MDHYQDIQLLPDPEFPTTVLMNALYAKLHRALVLMASRSIGISFPELSLQPRHFGARLRLHASAEDLKRLMAHPWLTGLRDYTEVGPLSAIPDHHQHRIVRRVQSKSSPARMRRRLMRRKGISEEQALIAIPDSVASHLTLPFVTMTSQSTGQRFHLFIEQRAPQPEPIPGEFNCYGLSSIATVPWF